MIDFLKKHWINALGLGLIFTGFLYFLKHAIDQEWLPIEARIALSAALGFTGLFFGHQQFHKKKETLGQVLAGMGTAILYATIGYLSFSDGINWSKGAGMLSMAVVATAVCGLSMKNNMRILFLVSLCGGLITPYFIEAPDTMDVPLFVYMIVLNIAALAAAVIKGWDEMKVIAFLSSLGVYTVYYVIFDPINWGKPFIYVSAFFLVYAIGLLVSSYHKGRQYEGMDLFLGLLNSISFIFWSIIIFDRFSKPHAIPLLIVGLVFLAISTFIYLSSDRKFSVGLGAYAILGVLVLGIAGHDMGLIFNERGMDHVISASVWLGVVSLFFIGSRKVGAVRWAHGSVLAFIALIVYWYSVAWDVEWVEIFGLEYIPFLNPGALVWISMAILSFTYSRYAIKAPVPGVGAADMQLVSTIMALIGHVLVGGLLTVQILNLWEAYDIGFVSEQLSLSVCWFVYALILFFWGGRNKQAIFSSLGAAVLLISAAKVFFFDIHDETAIQKVLFLIAMGGVTLLIAKVRSKYQERDMTLTETEE